MDFKKEITEKLNKLIRNNLESAAVYKQAFDKSTNTQLKVFFRTRAKQRQQFAEELRKEVLGYGKLPEESTSFTSKLDRGWINIKTLFSSEDERIILEKCLDSDKEALEDYKDLITEKNLPPSLDALFMKHHNEIQSTINKDRMHLETATA